MISFDFTRKKPARQKLVVDVRVLKLQKEYLDKAMESDWWQRFQRKRLGGSKQRWWVWARSAGSYGDILARLWRTATSWWPP